MRTFDKKFITGSFVGLIIGFGVVYAYAYEFSPTGKVVTSCAKQYKLTSQQIPCMSLDVQTNQLHALDTQLDSAAALYISEGKATKISVWVRDLNSSQYAATNETDTFAPASLMKLPLMIAYFKIAELEPTILTTQLTYAATSTLNDDTQDFPPAQVFVPGSKQTVEALIEDMMINSDNNATAVLLQHLDPQILQNTLIDLGIEIPQNTGTIDFVTVKSYSGIFRMLFNSSYLSRDFSEKALEIMNEAAFKGLATPLPATVEVAHKFGEREAVNSDGSIAARELHDCGIVYNGTKPYAICIMTTGTDFSKLQTVISDLSALTYSNLKV